MARGRAREVEKIGWGGRGGEDVRRGGRVWVGSAGGGRCT